MRSSVSCDVARPGIISTSLITGTGFIYAAMSAGNAMYTGCYVTHKVHADDLLGAIRRSGNLSDGDGARIRSKDSVRLRCLAKESAYAIEKDIIAI